MNNQEFVSVGSLRIQHDARICPRYLKDSLEHLTIDCHRITSFLWCLAEESTGTNPLY